MDCGQCVNLSIEEKPADESDPSLCGISRMSPTPFERDLFFTMLQLVHMNMNMIHMNMNMNMNMNMTCTA